MRDAEIKQVFDALGPEPGMKFEEFRKQVRELSDPARMRQDFNKIMAQRNKGRRAAAEINSKIKLN